MRLIISKNARYAEKYTGHEMCAWFLSTGFVQNIFSSGKYSASYSRLPKICSSLCKISVIVGQF